MASYLNKSPHCFAHCHFQGTKMVFLKLLMVGILIAILARENASQPVYNRSEKCKEKGKGTFMKGPYKMAGDAKCGFDGWTAGDEGSNDCYKITGRFLSWTQSEDLCQYWGGHLASIEDNNENEHVRNMTWGLTEFPIWIGLRKAFTPNFTWFDNSKSTYRNWQVGQPIVEDSSDICVKLTKTYTWVTDFW